MYLLNNQQILRAVETLRRGERLDIFPFERSCLQHTAYYFRLGDQIIRTRPPDGHQYGPYGPPYDSYIDQVIVLSESERYFRMEPREYVRIRSFERFALDHATLAILGGLSDLHRRACQLVHSPFVDPLFPSSDPTSETSGGFLELGLLNLSEDSVTLEYKQLIGKIAFFDVSDTYPVELIKGSASERKFRERAADDE